MSTGEHQPGDEPVDELFEALRGAWQQLPSPAPDRPLEDEDPATRRAVHWMRDAWLALPVPAAAAPLVAQRRIEPARWLRVAAAALLLLALGVPLLVATRHRMRGELSSADPAATVMAVDAHHLELRSGPVRLYLITDPITPHDEVPR